MQNPDGESLQSFQRAYPSPLIRGFFHRNKSAGLFPKLKNEALEKRREQGIGEVVGVERGCFLGVQLFRGECLVQGQRYLMQTPEGKSIPFTLEYLQHSDLSSAFRISEGLALIGHIGGVGPKSFILPA